MSLTSLIDDRSSPLAQWMDSTFDRRAISDLVSEVNDHLGEQSILLYVEHGEYALVGTAFDYLFRWQFGPLEKAVALNGALVLALKGWKLAVPIVRHVLKVGNRANDYPHDQAVAAVILSWFEAVFRSPRMPHELLAARDFATGQDAVTYLRQQIKPDVVNDLLLLKSSIPHVWQGQSMTAHHLNPTFAGSMDVGGADADWIFDGTLYDCKVSKVQRPFSRREVLQVLGYTLLDYDDTYHIHSVGWYYARQQARLTYPLDDLLDCLHVAQPLAALRREVRKLLRGG
ncbi:MAG: hypothetical protein H6672_08550 [Anaerolineaceae bacterium]|nr:hypothetical protein [Anaerolineaceae bacterium]